MSAKYTPPAMYVAKCLHMLPFFFLRRGDVLETVTGLLNLRFFLRFIAVTNPWGMATREVGMLRGLLRDNRLTGTSIPECYRFEPAELDTAPFAMSNQASILDNGQSQLSIFLDAKGYTQYKISMESNE